MKTRTAKTFSSKIFIKNQHFLFFLKNKHIFANFIQIQDKIFSISSILQDLQKLEMCILSFFPLSETLTIFITM